MKINNLYYLESEGALGLAKYEPPEASLNKENEFFKKIAYNIIS